jgi:taurine--2-oxoglutarate transaminase
MVERTKSPERDADSTSIPHWHTPDGTVPTIVEGDGATVHDADGTAYLDFLSQLYCVNAGHGNRAIVDAMTDQLERIQYVSSSKHNDARTELANRLAAVAPGRLNDVYFAVSGSEANEAAIQFAREYQDAPKVLTRWQSYHGGTYGAASLTGDPGTRATVERYAATSGTAKFLPPLAKTGAFDAETPEELARQAGDHLEFVIENEGADSIAAILTEPIGGTSGAYPAPPGYFERVRELCDEYDILLISDEVITGFGRCGDWFGIDTEGAEPDVITFAKGVTSAYVPLAGTIVREDIGDWLREEGVGVGQTFAGHPVGCAAGVAALSEYENGLIERVRDLEPHLRGRLDDLASGHDAISEVRGRGFLWAVVFADPETGEPFVNTWTEDDENPVAAVREAATERGVLFGSGRPDVQVIVAPPLCATEDEIDRAVDTLDDSIATVFD